VAKMSQNNLTDSVIPAKAGIQWARVDSGFRRNDVDASSSFGIAEHWSVKKASLNRELSE